jgi:hypothetical protein
MKLTANSYYVLNECLFIKLFILIMRKLKTLAELVAFSIEAKDLQQIEGGNHARPTKGKGKAIVTTAALGEESTPSPSTKALGEEGTPPVTTAALGEEGAPLPSTKALGEEGGPVPTTLAIGEE